MFGFFPRPGGFTPVGPFCVRRRRKVFTSWPSPSGRRRSALTEERDTLLRMAADHEVLTLKEVSQILEVHPITLYKMVRAGKIPSFRIGTDWRFRKDLLIRWMAERTVG
jgi:excisionase family DNA binding protein